MANICLTTPIIWPNIATMNNMPTKSQAIHAAVLFDQVGSRNSSDRDAELSAIRRQIRVINDELSDILIVPISMSRGDELQALVRDPVAAWRIVETFDTESRGRAFRFTIGVGEVTTRYTDSTWEMDGPCFHRARDAMQHARKSKRWVTFRGFDGRRDGILDGAARMLQLIRSGWTERQREAYSCRRRSNLQITAAKSMGLDQSTLSKILKAAHYKEYIEMESAMMDLLDLFWGELVVGSGLVDRGRP